MIDGDNLHRVVVYRDGMTKAQKMLPFSALDSPDPEDLWNFMENMRGQLVVRLLQFLIMEMFPMA